MNRVTLKVIKSHFNNITLTACLQVFSDSILEKQPTTVQDALEIYQQISTNFGSKDSLYNQSVPMSVVLMPLQTVIYWQKLT
jgi:hypothetical protein